MKKNIIYILCGLLLLANSGCTDYLDKAPDATFYTDDEIFTTYDNSQEFVDRLLIKSRWDVNTWDPNRWGNEYDKVSGLPSQMNGSRDRITDDCFSGVQSSSEKMWKIRRGNFLEAQNDQKYRWEPNQYRRFSVKWKAIRIACLSISNIDRLLDATDEEKARILGLAYFMKAHFYFQIVQNWGGMPWIDEPLDPSGDLDLPRDDYKTSMQNIAETFDLAAKYCPDVVTGADWGRPSKTAALAYKAKALLFAASPFANPDNDTQLWADAALAAAEALDAAEASGYYQLIPLDKWRTIFHGCGGDTFKEVLYGILAKQVAWYKGTPDWKYSGIKSAGFSKGSGAESVSENLAKCFAWANGDPIDQTTDEYKKHPFTGDGVNHNARDPRFDLSIVYNGQANPMPARYGRTVQIWNESYDGKDAEELKKKSDGTVDNGYTKTGYYNWKLKYPGNTINKKSKSDQMFNYIRMADVYLFYAEAANRAYGPTGIVPGHTMSAVDALNKIRIRANMPIYDNSTPGLTIGGIEEFEKKIRNENRIETCFEGKRFYNLRRWRLLTDPEVTQITGMYIKRLGVNNFEYSVVPMDETYNLLWDERHYLFPVPQKNVYIGPNFQQNPGW